MPRSAAVQLSKEVLTERSSAYASAYQAVSDAIDSDVDNELVDSAFLHPLTRARDYLGKESGKMARQLKQAQKAEKDAAPAPQNANGTDKTPAGAGAGKS